MKLLDVKSSNFFIYKFIIMKKTSFILLVCSLIFFCGYSQDSKYQVTYSINLDKLYKNTEKESLMDLFKMVANTSKTVQLELFINTNMAVFKEKKGMVVGDEIQDNLRKLVSINSYSGIWMSDLNKKRQIFVREFENKKFFVEKPLVTRNWQYSKETKTIQGYLCHKATFVKTVPKGKFKITAWYTKDIPVALGPVDYVGELPGLILELEDITATYKATTVKLKTDVIIKWPDEKDIITEKQYKKEGDKVMEFYKKSN